ncbi:MAG: hypothetical protein AAGH64_12730, partial [Planctomycetota bacterium]
TQGNVGANGIDIDALASEGVDTLRVAFSSDPSGPHDSDGSIWGLGAGDGADGSTRAASLWDLGSDAFDDDIDWAVFEEVL